MRRQSKRPGFYWVYIVRCRLGTYYVGCTNDLEKRIKRHNTGQGAKYLRGRGPVELVYRTKCPTFAAALRLEWKIKQLSHSDKERLLSQYSAQAALTARQDPKSTNADKRKNMNEINEKEFLRLASKGGLIPVFREIPGDLETPVSAYFKISKANKYSFLLESVEGGEKLARYSFLAAAPECVLESKGRVAKIIRFTKKGPVAHAAPFRDSPLEIVRELISKYNYVNISGLPGFSGGFVGYLGYDMVRFFENLPEKTEDDLGLPDMVLMLAKDLLIFDHLHHTIKVISCTEIDSHDDRLTKIRKFRQAHKRIAKMVGLLSAPLPKLKRARQKSSSAEAKATADLSKTKYESMVSRAKEEIRSGEIIQVVLSQRFKVDCPIDSIELYRTLRNLNPSPYMYLLNLDGLNIVGSSPELLMRCENGIVETRPIAGTRPRGHSLEDDLRLEQELLNDPKERAEHVMLVDLGRNDLGRVCREGSVRVTDLMSVERFSHVMHIVSNVRGELAEGQDALSALQSVFPAGTLSGAPKVRAMQIIEELETKRRGPYGGCVGYFSFSGNIDTCITIRTIVLSKGSAYIQAGAGIVADSDPFTEYNETLNKAKAQIKALQLAQRR
jgi:anthranilate synthase component 1